MSTGSVDALTTVSELDYIPEIMTLSGIVRMWGKAKNTVMMRILKGDLEAYRDGRIVLVRTIEVVKLWGIPEGFKK